MVTVYTKTNCRPCLQTKKTLDRMNVDYNEVSIDENPEAIAKFSSYGFKAAPIVETSDNVWSGFKPDNLKALSV